VRLALVCCLAWGKSAGLKTGHYKGSEKNTPGFPEGPGTSKNARARRLHGRTHYGARKLQNFAGETGWKLVPRGDGAAGNVAVACDLRDGGACVAGDGTRANSEALRALRFLRVTSTDLTDGKTWTPQHAHSLKQAKAVHARVCARVPRFFRKGIAVHGALGRWKKHIFAVAALKDLILRGHAGIVLRLPASC